MAWRESDGVQVLVGMLKLLGVFAPANDRFPAVAIDTVVELERRFAADYQQPFRSVDVVWRCRLGRSIFSPFRPALVPYLESVASKALELFLDKLTSPGHLGLFLSTLRASEPLRRAFIGLQASPKQNHLLVDKV